MSNATDWCSNGQRSALHRVAPSARVVLLGSFVNQLPMSSGRSGTTHLIKRWEDLDGQYPTKALDLHNPQIVSLPRHYHQCSCILWQSLRYPALSEGC